jgi:hypothetical protein
LAAACETFPEGAGNLDDYAKPKPRRIGWFRALIVAVGIGSIVGGAIGWSYFNIVPAPLHQEREELLADLQTGLEQIRNGFFQAKMGYQSKEEVTKIVEEERQRAQRLRTVDEELEQGLWRSVWLGSGSFLLFALVAGLTIYLVNLRRV